MRTRRGYGYQLSKFERNELFLALQSPDVPIAGFELGEESIKVFDTAFTIKSMPLGKRIRRTATIIRHRETVSIFSVVKVQHNQFRAQYDSGERKPEWQVLNYDDSAGENISWSRVLGYARAWVSDIKRILRETGTSDLWEELKSGRGILGSQKDIENTSFTAIEQTEISAWTRQLKEHLKTIPELDPAAVSEIEDRLEHLEKASERVGRKDWVMMFNGAITSLILSDFLPAQTVEHIIMMAVQGLGHLFGMGGPPQLLSGG